MTGLTGTNVCTSWIMQSDDDGASWSAPRDITAQLKRATATSLASGPGIGIELRRGPHAGRLVMPFNEGPAGRWRVFAMRHSSKRGSLLAFIDGHAQYFKWAYVYNQKDPSGSELLLPDIIWSPGYRRANP